MKQRNLSKTGSTVALVTNAHSALWCSATEVREEKRGQGQAFQRPGIMEEGDRSADKSHRAACESMCR